MLWSIKENKLRKEIFIGILTLILVQSIVFTNAFASSNTKSFDQQQQPAQTNVTQNPTKTFTDIFKQTQNSTIQIKSTIPDNNEVIIVNGNPIGKNNVALGSGFVYDNQGHIVTNNHVVSGANKIEVTFVNGNTYSAKVIGGDPYTDLAVLEITDNNFSPQMVVPLMIGNSSNLQPGETVAAIGNPFGLYGSITEGIVSGVGRLLPLSETESIDPQQGLFSSAKSAPAFSIPNIIQTDAAINPGNSGGPLLNMNGEVIGINTAIFSATGVYSGVGFAIPSYLIQKVVPSLITTGEYQHPYLGISGTDIDADIAEIMKLQNTTGFLVIQVTAGSPADKAGIHGGSILTKIDGRDVKIGGDVIVGIDDKPIRKIDDILSYLDREKKVGENVTLSIVRNGQIEKLDLTLANRPASAVLGSEIMQETREDKPALGITGINVTPEIASQMNVPANITNGGKGFLVIDVLRNGSAESAGVRGGYIASNIDGNQIELGGDIIIGIDNTTIGSVEDIKKALSTKQIGDSAQLTIYRDNNTLSVPIVLKKESQQDLVKNTIPLFPPPSTSPQLPGDSSPFQPFNPFNDFGDDRGIYDQCVKIMGKDTCDKLFGR